MATRVDSKIVDTMPVRLQAGFASRAVPAGPRIDIVLAEDGDLRVELIAKAAAGTWDYQSKRFKQNFHVDRITLPLAHHFEVFGGVSKPMFGKLRITRLHQGKVVEEHIPSAAFQTGGVITIIDIRTSQVHVPSSVRLLGHKAADLLFGTYECINPDALGRPRERQAAAFVSAAGAVVRPRKMDVAAVYEAFSGRALMSLGELAATFNSPNGLSIACAMVLDGCLTIEQMSAEPSKILVRQASQIEWSDGLRCLVLARSAQLGKSKNELSAQLAVAAGG